jgi:putative SOS response-associated peptidase YedK
VCGRGKITADPAELVEAFGLAEIPHLRPRFNLPPTDPIPVIRSPGRLELLQWGTRRDRKPWYLVRSESLGSWKNPKRCLIVLDGFYEWRKDKHPFLFERPDHKPFALAGVWTERVSGDGEITDHAFVVTVPASERVAPIHDRMPLVLRPGDYARWFDGASVEAYDGLQIVPVSQRVNSVRNDDPACVERTEPQGTLF